MFTVEIRNANKIDMMVDACSGSFKSNKIIFHLIESKLSDLIENWVEILWEKGLLVFKVCQKMFSVAL